jgi:hypothetical protein
MGVGVYEPWGKGKLAAINFLSCLNGLSISSTFSSAEGNGASIGNCALSSSRIITTAIKNIHITNQQISNDSLFLIFKT